jgi:thioredoxin-related protein
VRLNSDTTGGTTHQFDGRTVSTKELASMFGARGVPTTVFLTPDGSPIAHQPGFIERPTFFTMIRFVGSGAYRTQSFREFSGR